MLTALGWALEAIEPRAIALRDCEAREGSIDEAAGQAGPLVGVAHAQTRARRNAFKFPALQSSHTVRILKLPFEQLFPAIGCDYHRERDFALAELAGDLHFLADDKIGSAALHLEMRIHFCAVPERHALRNE